MKSTATLERLTSLELGTALCALCSGSEPAAEIFVRVGFEAGDQALLLGHPETTAALAAEVQNPLQLRIVSDAEALRPAGRFEVDALAAFLTEAAREARQRGFRTLRVVAEMAWLVGSEGVEPAQQGGYFELAERLDTLVAQEGCLALWCWDRRRFAAADLLDAVADHRELIVDGELLDDFDYLPTDDAMIGGRSPETLGRWLELVDERQTEEREPAERAPEEGPLRDSPSLLRTLLETLGEGIVVSDLEGRFLHWNPSAARILSRGPTRADPATWSERYGVFLGEGDTLCPAAELPLVRALGGEHVDHQEMLVRPARGCQRVWVSVSARPLIDRAGETRGAILVLRDVTRRKAAEESLRESQSRLELLNKISTTHTSGMAVQRVIERAVEPIAEQFSQYRVAYATADAEGYWRTLYALGPPGMPEIGGRGADLAAATDYLGELRAGQQVLVADIARDPRMAPIAALLKAEGSRARLDEPLYHSEKLVGVLSLESPRPQSWTLHERLTLRQTVEYLSLAINDARAQEERRWAELALRRSNEELQAFAHSISHDLKAPLRAIQGFSEALVEDYGPQLDDNAHRYLAFISDGATRMGELIEDLLQHARLGRGGVKLAEVDLHDIAGRVVQSLTRIIEETGATVEIEGHLPTLLGHRATLELMLQNLVSNALKFVPDGEAPRVEISATTEKNHHRVGVRDYGIGIDPKYHAGIFDIFHRLHSAAAYPGTGIGLAIVKKGATLHDGGVLVDSAPGRGSIFSFTIPRKPKGSHGP